MATVIRNITAGTVPLPAKVRPDGADAVYALAAGDSVGSDLPVSTVVERLGGPSAVAGRLDVVDGSWSWAGGGTVTEGSIRQALSQEQVLSSGQGWTLRPTTTGTGAAFLPDGGVQLTIESGVEAADSSGAICTSAFRRSAVEWTAVWKVKQHLPINSGWQRATLRVGVDRDNCLAVWLSGAGSIDLGYYSQGGWTGVAGRGGNADIRTPYTAGNLFVVLHRSRTGFSVEAYSGADIDAAMAAGPIAFLSSADTTAMRVSTSTVMGFDLATTGPVSASDVRLLEAATEVGT